MAAATDFDEVPYGGIATFIDLFCNHLDRSHVRDVLLVGITRDNIPLSLRISGRHRDVRRGSAPLFHGLPSRMTLAHHILSDSARRWGSDRWDVFYAHSPELAWALIKRYPETPCVLHLHGTESSLIQSRFGLARSRLVRSVFGHRVQRPAVAKAFAVFVTSDRSRFERFRDTLPEQHRSKCIRVPAMVDRRLFAAPSMRGGTERIQLLTGGRLVAGKGVDLVIRATQLLLSRGVPIALDVLGDGVERNRLDAVVRKLDLRGVVQFRGHVDRASVAGYLARADVFVSGSSQEGFSMALLEALACGVPCVGFDVGGWRDVVRPGETGELVSERSPEAVAGAIQRLLPVKDSMRTACAALAAEYDATTVSNTILTSLVRVAEAGASRADHRRRKEVA